MNDEQIPDRSTARLRVLAAASQAFATVARDYALLLQRIARTTADLIGDGCLVTLLADDGESLVNAASAHREPALEIAYREFLAGFGASKTSSQTVSAQVMRTGEPKLVSAISPEDVVARSDDALKPLVRQLNVHSFAVVPIRAQQKTLGTLSLFRSAPGHGYTGDDLTLLYDLADRAGLAIENARFYEDLERRVRERTAELEAVNKQLQAFSYSVAHDLRAPLRSIDGFSHALLEECSDRLSSEELDYLMRVRGAAQRMALLIDGLLHLSRTTRAEFQREHVDLSSTARIVMNRLREAEPNRVVEAIVAPGVEAHADPHLTHVVLTNLLGNAWKFTSKREGARIEFGAEPDSYPQIFFVRDNGVGFDPEYAANLFGVFQRLHRQEDFAGTGIGLATVHGIVLRHGGRLWADAKLDWGATFYFTLAGHGPSLPASATWRSADVKRRH